jgi:hypothetical protein
MENMGMKIAYAVILGLMVLFLFPRAKQMLKHSPKATGENWRSLIFPILFVVLFVLFLMQLV